MSVSHLLTTTDELNSLSGSAHYWDPWTENTTTYDLAVFPIAKAQGTASNQTAVHLSIAIKNPKIINPYQGPWTLSGFTMTHGRDAPSLC